MAPLRLFVLGPPRLERGGQPVEVSLRRGLALLVYLAVTGQPQSRESLAALLWPESDEREARGRLRRTLHRLGEALGESVIEVVGETLRLAPAANLELDSREFEREAAAGLGAGAARAGPAALTRAADLYGDDFLAGFAVPESAAWEEWQFLQREHLRQRLGQVLERLASVHGAEGAFPAAVSAARRWVALDPLHEPAQRALMRAYALAGQPAAALRQYRECARLLEAELGVAPEPETNDLYEAIRTRRLIAPAPEPAEPASPSPVPETRYARSGDVSIAYQVVGDGPIDVVFVMGWVSHLDYFWEEPGFARFLSRLASFSRLILFDKRGTGLSDRAVGLPTLEERMDDVRAVMDAVGSERAALFGISEGGPMAILFAATYPERTTALIVDGTFARRLWAPDYPWGPDPEERERFVQDLYHGWGERAWVAKDLERRAPGAAADERFKRWWSTYLRMSASPGAAVALTQMNAQIDVRHVLPAIRVPTLVIHRTGDRTVPVEAGRFLARQIPGARYVELPGDDHLPFVGDQDAILDEVERFLAGVPPAAELDRVLVTLLHLEAADVPASTTVTGHSGAERPDAVRAIARKHLARFRGNEVHLSEQGVLATFDGPARAIRCACAVRDEARALGIEVRAGLHTGECDLLDGQVRGIAVHIAARVMAHAGKGDVLVSSTVKDLVAGSGIRFEDLGVQSLDGVPGEWRLYRVVPGLPSRDAASTAPALVRGGFRPLG